MAAVMLFGSSAWSTPQATCPTLEVIAIDALTEAPIASASILNLTTGDTIVTDASGYGVFPSGDLGISEHTLVIGAPGYPQHFRTAEIMVGSGDYACQGSAYQQFRLRMSPEAMYMSPVINASGGVFRFEHDTGQTLDGEPFMQSVRLEVPAGAWAGRYRIGVTPVAHPAFNNAFLPPLAPGAQPPVPESQPILEFRLSAYDLNGNPVDLGVLAEDIRMASGSSRVDVDLDEFPGATARTFNESTHTWSDAGVVGTSLSSNGQATLVDLDRITNFSVLPHWVVNPAPLPATTPTGDQHQFCEWSLQNKHVWPCGTGTAAPIDSAQYLCDPCGQLNGTATMQINEKYTVTVDKSAVHKFSATAADKLTKLGFEATGKVGTVTTYAKTYTATKSPAATIPGKCGTQYLYPL